MWFKDTLRGVVVRNRVDDHKTWVAELKVLVRGTTLRMFVHGGTTPVRHRWPPEVRPIGDLIDQAASVAIGFSHPGAAGLLIAAATAGETLLDSAPRVRGALADLDFGKTVTIDMEPSYG